MSSTHYDPKILTDARKHVSELCKEANNEDKELYFSLSCDEMAVRKHMEFDGKQLQSFVNVGKRTVNSDTEEKILLSLC